MKPDEIVDVVKASGLRGRGGAGFPTGMKWQFVDKKSPKPKLHLLQRRRERAGDLQGSPVDGAQPAPAHRRVRDRLLRHRLEGGLHLHPRRVPARAAHSRRAIAEAHQAGYLGKNIFGSGFDCEVFMHRGAGAYEAGEETALIESLEGKRAQPRIKPPFPASRRPVQLPDGGQQRRDALQRAARSCCAASSGSRRSVPRRTAVRSCSASAAT